MRTLRDLIYDYLLTRYPASQEAQLVTHSSRPPQSLTSDITILLFSFLPPPPPTTPPPWTP